MFRDRLIESLGGLELQMHPGVRSESHPVSPEDDFSRRELTWTRPGETKLLYQHHNFPGLDLITDWVHNELGVAFAPRGGWIDRISRRDEEWQIRSADRDRNIEHLTGPLAAPGVICSIVITSSTGWP